MLRFFKTKLQSFHNIEKPKNKRSKSIVFPEKKKQPKMSENLIETPKLHDLKKLKQKNKTKSKITKKNETKNDVFQLIDKLSKFKLPNNDNYDVSDLKDSFNSLALKNQEKHDDIYKNIYLGDIEEKLFTWETERSWDFKAKNVANFTRAKMIDWIYEVFFHYKETSCMRTVFRAIEIMDLYLKEEKNTIKNEDVHLIGITSMFIATKYEDLYFIPLAHFVSYIGHFKFSDEEILQKELEILETLNFDIGFTTSYDFLLFFLYKTLPKRNSEYFQIKKNSELIMKIALQCGEMLPYSNNLIAICSLIFGIKHFHKIQKKEDFLIQNIFTNLLIDEDSIEKCFDSLLYCEEKVLELYPNLDCFKKFVF